MNRRLLTVGMLLCAAVGALFFPNTSRTQEVRSYFIADVVGSPVAATDPYANLTWTEDYLPYGDRRVRAVNSGDNQRWFTAAEQNEDSGLIYSGARFYDPVLGRFLSVDPDSVSVQSGANFNRYWYANNNPYAYVDPVGRNPASPTDWYDFAKDNGRILVNEIVWVAATALGNDGVANLAIQEMVDGRMNAAISTAGLINPMPGTSRVRHALEISEDVAKVSKKGGTVAKSATSSRVKLRKGTREQIEAGQPRNASGEMVDPNSGQPLRPGGIDVGHKPGHEWRTRRQMHGEAGSTRREVIEAENNADLYHLEDRASNRSHRYERK